MPHRGVLISFEGVEGSGKSTQVNRLLDRLTARGVAAVLTHEPGGTTLGEWVRRLLLARPDAPSTEGTAQPLPAVELAPLEEFLLFSVARARLVNEVVRPNLEQGRVVLVDRYYHSSYAYQSAGGLEAAWMREVTVRVVGDCIPDLVILLDLPAEQGLDRNHPGTADVPADRFEMRELGFHRRVRNAYLKLAREEPGRIRIVNAASEAEAVSSEIEDIVDEMLAARGGRPKKAGGIAPRGGSE